MKWFAITLLVLVMVPVAAYAQTTTITTTGQNYDLVEDHINGIATWTSHPERIMVDNSWQNYYLTSDAQKVIFQSNSVGGIIYDIPTCSYSLYENGFDATQIIPSVSAVATYLKDGSWQNMAVNNESCDVTVSRNNDGIFLTSTRTLIEPFTNSTFANGTAVIYERQTEKFTQEIKIDISSGIKETFKVWNESDEQLGVSQTVHTGETINIAGNEINITQYNGQSFDRQFLAANQAEVFEIAQDLNYDFDIGFDSLSGLNIYHDTDYKVNLDYADGNFVNYLEIDPVINSGGTGVYDITVLHTHTISTGTIDGIAMTASEISSLQSAINSVLPSWSHAGNQMTVTYTIPIQPAPPQNLSSVSGMPISLTWDAVSDDGGAAISQYEVQRSTYQYAEQPLPDNQGSDGMVDMASNVLLLHLDDTVMDAALTHTVTSANPASTFNPAVISNGIINPQITVTPVSMPSANDPYTVMSWVNMDNTDTTSTLMSFPHDMGVTRWDVNHNQITLGNGLTTSSSDVFADIRGVPHHVAVTGDGLSTSFYLDGILTGTSSHVDLGVFAPTSTVTSAISTAFDDWNITDTARISTSCNMGNGNIGESCLTYEPATSSAPSSSPIISYQLLDTPLDDFKVEYTAKCNSCNSGQGQRVVMSVGDNSIAHKALIGSNGNSNNFSIEVMEKTYSDPTSALTGDELNRSFPIKNGDVAMLGYTWYITIEKIGNTINTYFYNDPARTNLITSESRATPVTQLTALTQHVWHQSYYAGNSIIADVKVYDSTGSLIAVTEVVNSAYHIGALPDGTNRLSGVLDEFAVMSDSLDSQTIQNIADRGLYTFDTVGTTGTITTYNDNTITAGNEYTYRIIADNGAFDSEPSNTITETAGISPDPPTGLTAAINDPDNLPYDTTVSWSTPANVGSGTLTGFEVYRDGVLIATTGLTNTYADNVPSPNTTYTYYTKAVSNHGVSVASNSDAVTTANVPDAISDLAGTVASNRQIDLAWSAPNDGGAAIQGYRVFKDGNFLASLGSTVTSYSDVSLTDGTTYTFEVYATNQVGQGPVSNAVILTTHTSVIGSIAIVDQQIGATLQLNPTSTISSGTPTPVFTTLSIYDNGALVGTQAFGTVYYHFTDSLPHTIELRATDTNHWNTPTITGTNAATSSTYNPSWSDNVSYNYTRSGGMMELTVNRDITPGWDLTCDYQTSNQAIKNQTGVQGIGTNMWAYHNNQTFADGQHVYVKCDDNGTDILSFTSHGTDIISGGINMLDVHFGDFLGAPAAILFVVIVAGMFTGRTAPTGILLILALVGVLGFVGFLAVDAATWGFILVAGILGLFVGKRFL